MGFEGGSKFLISIQDFLHSYAAEQGGELNQTALIESELGLENVVMQ